MKLSDLPEVEAEVYIAAAPDRVWALVTDLPRMGEWSPENMGGEWVSEGGPKQGALFRGRNHHPAVGEWETQSTVIALDEPRLFSWAVGDPANPGATWRFELVPEGDGTRVHQHVQIGPGPNGLTMAVQSMPDKEDRIVARRQQEHTDNMSATLAGIKAAAEAQ